MSRAEALARFHARSPWAAATRLPLAGDASLRRYERLTGGPSPALLVDAPPPEDTALFVAMAGWLRGQGLLAPEIHAADADAGFLVVEDFGDGLLARRCAERPEWEVALYEQAIDLLAQLQAAAPPSFLPPYDDAFFLQEIGIFAEWATSGAAGPDLLARWRDVLPQARIGADGVVHRDFHALNLIETDDRLALIDFQGARIGPPTYDLVSLLDDARRDVAPAAIAAARARYARLRPDLDPDRLAASAAIMSAQRNTKILGLFRRLAKRDGKPGYLALLPRVEGHLRRALAHPVLGDVRLWHETHGFGT